MQVVLLERVNSGGKHQHNLEITYEKSLVFQIRQITFVFINIGKSVLSDNAKKCKHSVM